VEILSGGIDGKAKLIRFMCLCSEVYGGVSWTVSGFVSAMALVVST